MMVGKKQLTNSRKWMKPSLNRPCLHRGLVDLKENDEFRGEVCKNLGYLVKKIKENTSAISKFEGYSHGQLQKFGAGIIDPAKIYDFYNDQHSYISSVGHCSKFQRK